MVTGQARRVTAALRLPLLLVAAVAVSVAAATPAPAKPAGQAALQPRFQQTAGSNAAASAAGSSDASASAAGAAASAAASQAESDAAHGRVRGGGEWWLKDPPWFLPPPPEWGPMPPTMYTSFFHKPRYPALSTANYYPLYSREDEYDAHLPASMSRRAAYTQQQIFDHYTATYRDHLNTPGVLAPGDPNMGVSNPTLYADHFLGGAMAGDAHARALGMQHPNSYVPQYAGGNSGHTFGEAYINGVGPAMAMSGAFLETGAGVAHVSRTHFLSRTGADAVEADADASDESAHADADVDADADEAVEAEDAEDGAVETEVSDAELAAEADADAEHSESEDAEADAADE